MRVLKTPYSNLQAQRIPMAPSPKAVPYLASEDVRKIALPTMEGIHFELVQNIISLEAKGNYTFLYLESGKQLLVCKTLMEMEEMLKNSVQFVRIHRSSTINLNKISKYIKGKGGYVIMDDGSTRNVSAGRKNDFFESLKKYYG